MTQTITATYENGVLKPDQPLNLPPLTRVRLVVEALSTSAQASDKEWEEFDRMLDEESFDSGGFRMTRDQLHERN